MWIKQSAAANGCEDEGQPERRAQHRRADVDAGHRNRGSRAQRDAIECAAVLPERRLAFGAAVDVIEHDPRQSPFRRLSKIFDADDTMGGESSIAHASMSWPPRTRRPQSQIDLSVFCELCGQLVDR